MENIDLNLQDEEERRRAGIPAIVRAVLPRNLWENPLNWKRTKIAMGFAVMLITATGATAAVTVGKKAAPNEGIQVASIVPTATQHTAPKSSTDTSLPSYSRTVDSGQKCGDQKVEVEDPDTVPGHPKLTALLATNPCFNFGWFENNGKAAVINYITAYRPPTWDLTGGYRQGGGWDFPGATKEMEKGAMHLQMVMDMNAVNGLLEAFTLDMVRRVTGPETVEEMKRLTKKLDQEMEKSKPKNHELDPAIKDLMFWNMVKKVAASEGLSVRLSDGTREREAADKMPGDFLLPGGTADRYKLILARMSPSDWEKFQIVGGLAEEPLRNGEAEKSVAILKQALSYLKDPREIHAAVDRIKSIPDSEIGKRAVTELGLS